MTPSSFPDRLRSVYNAPGREHLARQYDIWAGSYDHDLLHAGYMLPVVGAALAARYVRDKGSKILDAGAGTGQLGDLLNVLGYEDLTGIDLSTGMLAEAGRRGTYRSLIQADLLEPLAFPDGAFDAVLAIGIFGLGHVTPLALDELSRVVTMGGHIIFSVSEAAYREQNFENAISEMKRVRQWEIQEATRGFSMYNLCEEVRSLQGSMFVVKIKG